MKRCLAMWTYGWLKKKWMKYYHLKKEFYSHLNMWDITDGDCMHWKRVWKNFKIKKLAEYKDMYVQSNTFLLADVFLIFQKMFLEIYELNSACFLTAPGIAWQAALEKTK